MGDLPDDEENIAFSMTPKVTAYENSAGDLLGARLEWNVTIEPVEYGLQAFYDAAKGRFTQVVEREHYNGDILDRRNIDWRYRQ